MPRRLRAPRKSPETSALPTTEYAVLGLLCEREMSGYDIRRALEASVGYFWTPAKSHIYGVLARLADQGLATRREVEQEQRPDKQLYRITKQGEDALRAWLENVDTEPDASRHPILLKIFFGRRAGPGQVAALIERRLREEEAFVAELEEIERRLAGQEEHFYGYLTVQFGLARARATVEWARQALGELERRSE